MKIISKRMKTKEEIEEMQKEGWQTFSMPTKKRTPEGTAPSPTKDKTKKQK